MNLAKYYSKIRQDIAITTFYSGMSGMIPVLKAAINNTQAKLLHSSQIICQLERKQEYRKWLKIAHLHVFTYHFFNLKKVHEVCLHFGV